MPGIEHSNERDEAFITKLPLELLLNVLLYLDVAEILCLRKTCQQMNHITQERPTWIHLLHVYQTFLPIHRDAYKTYHCEDTSLPSYSSTALESVVRYAKYTADIWATSREPPFRLQVVPTATIHGELVPIYGYRKGSTLLGMQLFLDSWLLVVYAEGVANLYDVSNRDEHLSVNFHGIMGKDGNSSSEKRKTLKAQLDRVPWNSFSAVFDETLSRILLVVARSPPMNILEVYEISLHSLDQPHDGDRFLHELFQKVGHKTLATQRSIRYVDPMKRVIVLSSSSKIEVLQWSNSTEADHEGNTMTWKYLQRSKHVEPQTLPEDLEELWNGVLGARLLGDYVLIFRTRSLEIYHYLFPQDGHNSGSQPRPNTLESNKFHVQLKHTFSLTFRDTSFSEVATSWIPASNADSYELKVIAYDVIQGLFQYVVKLLVPRPGTTWPDSEVLEPTLEVKLLGVYPLSFGGTFKPKKGSSLISSVSSTLTMQSPTSGSTTPTPIMSHSHSLFQARMTDFGSRGASATARGFISAHSMGPQGKRAVWVERKRSSTVREVQVWAMEPPAPVAPSDLSEFFNKEIAHGGHEINVHDDLPLEFENQVVYSANSYDLRDDIVLCTFSELHGTIVLGHRSGEVSVLDCPT